MKFLKTEYKDIKTIVLTLALTYEEYELVLKGGLKIYPNQFVNPESNPQLFQADETPHKE